MGYFDTQDSGADLLNSPEEIANAVAGYQQLRGTNTNGIGSVFPPRLRGGSYVPIASGCRVTSSSSLNGQSVVTLSWFDPPRGVSRISSYNVYVKSAVGANQAPQLVASSLSPAKFTFQTDNINNVAFVVQTVMQNGQTSALDASPTCTVTSASPTLNLPPASPQVLVSGLTLTNNSPGAGSIAWSACSVYYNGTTYAIAGSNTSSAFVTWTVAAGSFSGAASFAPGQTVFLIATNTSGTADTAWNKVGATAIQESNLAFGLLVGQQLQPPATLTKDDAHAGILAFGSVETALLNTTGAGGHTGGGLLSVSVRVVSPRTDGTAQNDFKWDLKFQIDSNTAQTLPLFDTGGLLFSNTASDMALRTQFGIGATAGFGGNAGDTLVLSFNIGFKASLYVAIVQTSTSNQNPTTPNQHGNMAMLVSYCTKTT